MEMTNSLPLSWDITGQVSIVDYMPKFSGNYSTVYLGSFKGNHVAIKAIKAASGEDSVKRKILREITLWADTNHRNVHPFYGFANDKLFGPFGALVSPWCTNGDATQYLKENGERMVPAQRIALWRGVIEGVAYLHEHKPIIVHGDLKPGNVLIDDHGVPRICDFGLARVLLEVGSTGTTTTSEHTGTTRYLAPELVTSQVTVPPTTASDMYALGCLGLKFVYDQEPYSNHKNNMRGQIISDIKRNIPPAANAPNQSWIFGHTWSLITQLWSLNPRERPSAFHSVSLLSHAARSLPPIAMQRVVFFSATVEETSRDKEWKQRTRSLVTLSLVSRSFYACVIPFLYQDVRITESRLSSLTNALNDSSINSRLFDQQPPGHGAYTRTFVLCGENAFTLSADIQHLIDKMTGLHTLTISSDNILEWSIPVHSLRTITLLGFNPLWTLDQGMLRVLLPFQRLCIRMFRETDPYISQVRQDSLLPNRQDINLRGPACGITRPKQILRLPFQRLYVSLVGGSDLPNLQDITITAFGRWPQLFHAFKGWTMPRLNSLSCRLNCEQPSDGTAFIRFLQTQGPLLQYLELLNADLLKFVLSDALSLCSNLRSLVVVSEDRDLLSFPPHLKLEILDIEDISRPSKKQFTEFDKFTSSWRTQFPNLHVARFDGRENNFLVYGEDERLEICFRTEESFYTVKHKEKTYKCWEGKWIGADPKDSL